MLLVVQSVLVHTIALNHLLLSDQHLPLDPVDAPHCPPEHFSELYDQHDDGRVQLQNSTAHYIRTVLVTSRPELERERRLYVLYSTLLNPGNLLTVHEKRSSRFRASAMK